ncbi:MAG: Zinc finger, domain protein [Burkholderia sp.]|nr:Zinc finger, domain protein [Burkholderia sp.]
MGSFYGGWPKYVPVAQRRAEAMRKVEALKKKGRTCQPVAIEGRTVACTFWGKKWCDNLEAYSDYSNRLPRGRTYVRNGSVVDLQIAAGKITALVAGSEVYDVSITVHALEENLWASILGECAGKVASLVELLQGRLSSAVMEVVTRHGRGLFPAPKHIAFRCSCPDSAYMCKHVAAALYGVGARLDSQPELLFLLRHVDPQELIRQAGGVPVTSAQTAGGHRQLDPSDLSALFGIELVDPPVAASPATPAAKAPTVTPKRSGTVARPKRTKTVTASELIARGIPRHMLKSWLASGVLLRTEERGVYRTTRETDERVEYYLNQRHAAGR